MLFLYGKQAFSLEDGELNYLIAAFGLPRMWHKLINVRAWQ